MSRAARISRRRALPLFIAAHLGVVALTYGTALVAGGGLETAPFPPDEPLANTGAPIERTAAPSAPTHVAPSLVEPLRSSELDPPWRIDADGRVHVDER